MYISRHVIGDLYNQRLLLEMKSNVIDHVYDNYDPEDLPFNFLFKDKWRIVIPLLTVSKEVRYLKEKLKEIPNFDRVDVKTGEVVRLVKLDPKYGKGSVKEQRINIGTAISKLKIPFYDQKMLLDWWALYKDSFEDAWFEKSDQYVIIVSREPTDIVRMSDFGDTIESCHTYGKEYFQCALKESIEGGAIAYLVRREDLVKHQDKLQDPDLFDDSDDRGIDGIFPLARLRIRRLVDSTGQNEFAIPDIKVYGETIPGFQKTLAKWLRQKQPISAVAFERKNWTDPLRHVGGDYFDHRITELIDHFFDRESKFDQTRYNKPPEYGFGEISKRYSNTCANRDYEYFKWEDIDWDYELNDLNHYLDHTLNWDITENNQASVQYEFPINFQDFLSEETWDSLNANVELTITRFDDLPSSIRSLIRTLDGEIFTNPIRIDTSEAAFEYSDGILTVFLDLGTFYDEYDVGSIRNQCQQIDNNLNYNVPNLSEDDVISVIVDAGWITMESSESSESTESFLNELNGLPNNGWSWEKNGVFGWSISTPYIAIPGLGIYGGNGIHDTDFDIFLRGGFKNYIDQSPFNIVQRTNDVQYNLPITERKEILTSKYFSDFLNIKEFIFETEKERVHGGNAYVEITFVFSKLDDDGLRFLKFVDDNLDDVRQLLEYSFLHYFVYKYGENRYPNVRNRYNTLKPVWGKYFWNV